MAEVYCIALFLRYNQKRSARRNNYDASLLNSKLFLCFNVCYIINPFIPFQNNRRKAVLLQPEKGFLKRMRIYEIQ